MRKPDPRIWFPVALCVGFLLIILATVGPLAVGKLRPTELHPAAASNANAPDPRPWMKCETLAGLLRDQAPGLRFVHGPPYGRLCYVCEGDAEPPDVVSEEEYADCWRGVVLCVADPLDTPEGPHYVRRGDFLLFGDLELIERVRPAAEQIRFGPYRGSAP